LTSGTRLALGLLGLVAAASVLAAADAIPARAEPSRSGDDGLTDAEVADAVAWMVDRALAAAGSGAS